MSGQHWIPLHMERSCKIKFGNYWKSKCWVGDTGWESEVWINNPDTQPGATKISSISITVLCLSAAEMRRFVGSLSTAVRTKARKTLQSRIFPSQLAHSYTPGFQLCITCQTELISSPESSSDFSSSCWEQKEISSNPAWWVWAGFTCSHHGMGQAELSNANILRCSLISGADTASFNICAANSPLTSICLETTSQGRGVKCNSKSHVWIKQQKIVGETWGIWLLRTAKIPLSCACAERRKTRGHRDVSNTPEYLRIVSELSLVGISTVIK